MLLRGRSKERTPRKVTPPSPSYMSDEQLAKYLANLRDNQIARPNGARPPPSLSVKYEKGDMPVTAQCDSASRCPNKSSHRRALSNFSVSSTTSRQLVQQPQPGHASDPQSKPLNPSVVVPSATYIERGQRWMEKEEAVALRDALEDLDLRDEDEESRIHAAAQQEASELVWQHQNPESVRPDGPYKYRQHLRKNSYAHARSQSVSADPSDAPVTGLARDYRSISCGSQRSRVSSGSSGMFASQSEMRPSFDSVRELPLSIRPKKSYGGLGNPDGLPNRRRSSGKRNISGEPLRSFSGDQIWEEPEEETKQSQVNNSGDMPAPLRIAPRNPLHRTALSQLIVANADIVPEPPKKFARFDIHHNTPTRSRNPVYTTNPRQVPAPGIDHTGIGGKESIEIRGDDIRQATSMRLKDRSPKLPTPAFVSDKPGQPIVSFDANWKPNEADRKPVDHSRRGGAELPETNYSYVRSKEPPHVSYPKYIQQASVFPSIQLPITKPTGVNQKPSSYLAPDVKPTIPTINFPDIPMICVPDEPHAIVPDIPIINVADVSTDNVPTVPMINVSEVPKIAVSEPSDSSTAPEKNRSQRPLPDPKSNWPLPHQQRVPRPDFSRSHWSPAAGSRATATCHQCSYPIEGRVVALRGIKEKFHPQCFTCYICGTGLEALEISPEPVDKRMERIFSRIERRAQGEQLEEIESQTVAEDGDERLRFYCHLDWHELFAPRCKHCKTPIIGEHTVALGEHWHDGHFFCAECGDPFAPGQTHIEKDGYAWCLNCQTKRTERQAPKCTKCRSHVIGQYVEALGGEYHDECFRCVTCGHGFDDGQIFPKIDESGETVVMCTACMARELKA